MLIIIAINNPTTPLVIASNGKIGRKNSPKSGNIIKITPNTNNKILISIPPKLHLVGHAISQYFQDLTLRPYCPTYNVAFQVNTLHL